MSKYTDEELDSLLASGDAQENEDGSITWAVDNTQGKKPGTWLIRPPQAAPLINEETATALALRRHEVRRVKKEAGFALGIQKALEKEGYDLNEPLMPDDAVMALMAKWAEESMNIDRKDAVRLLTVMMEAMEMTPRKKVEIDQRQQTIDLSGSSIQLLEGSPAIQRLLNEKDDSNTQ